MRDAFILQQANRLGLDFEWVVLIKEALDQGIPEEEIRSFLSGTHEMNMNMHANMNVDVNVHMDVDINMNVNANINIKECR